MKPENLFNLLSDSTRLRMTTLLATEGELCVCEFTHALSDSQPKISRHLAIMREAGLVIARRQGIWMHYRICPELPDWANRIIETAAAEVQGMDPFRRDFRALCAMDQRPGGRSCA
jgi:DNA-binding transcriptional ArsR family regulator